MKDRLELERPPAQSEFEAAINVFAGLNLSLSKALDALVDSHARFHAVAAGEQPAGRDERQQRRRLMIAQAEAVSANAAAVAQLNDELVAMMPGLNRQWEDVARGLGDALPRKNAASPEPLLSDGWRKACEDSKVQHCALSAEYEQARRDLQKADKACRYAALGRGRMAGSAAAARR